MSPEDATSWEHSVILVRYWIAVDSKAGCIGIRVSLCMSNHWQETQVNLRLGQYAFLTGSFFNFPEGGWSLANDFKESLDDLFGLTSEHPGLGLPCRKQSINQAKPGVAFDFVENDGVIGLSDERSDMVKFHGFLDLDILTPMGLQK
jgi:hypothetical protein